MTARGIRNCNPLNIKFNPSNKFIGQIGPDADGFAIFDTPVNGVRAASVILQNYRDKHRIVTLRGAIERWAPATENDSAAYVRNVSAWANIPAEEPIDIRTHEVQSAIIPAMIRMETGATVAQSVIELGLARAGVVPQIKPSLQSSRTVKAAQIGAGTTVLGAGVESFKDAAEQVMDWAPIVQVVLRYSWWIVAGIALASFAAVIYARWDDKRKGLR
jgi:hypothetical protein